MCTQCSILHSRNHAFKQNDSFIISFTWKSNCCVQNLPPMTHNIIECCGSHTAICTKVMIFKSWMTLSMNDLCCIRWINAARKPSLVEFIHAIHDFLMSFRHANPSNKQNSRSCFNKLTEKFLGVDRYKCSLFKITDPVPKIGLEASRSALKLLH